VLCCAEALVLLGMNDVLKKGMYDPRNEGRDMSEVIAEEWKYMTEKLGISEKEPPSS